MSANRSQALERPFRWELRAAMARVNVRTLSPQRIKTLKFVFMCRQRASAAKPLMSATGSKVFGWWTRAPWKRKTQSKCGKSYQCQKYIKKAFFVCTLYTHSQPRLRQCGHWMEWRLWHCNTISSRLFFFTLTWPNSPSAAGYSTQPVRNYKSHTLKKNSS